MRKFEEIINQLRLEIQQGHYPVQERFASERKLMTRFKAARLTINKVTEQLVAEGYLCRGKRGAGTFVRETAPFPVGHLAYIGPIAQEHYAKIIKGCQRTALMYGYALSVFQPPLEQLNYFIKKLASSKYCGLLVSGIGLLDEDYPLPLVYLDNSLPDNSARYGSVTCTNYQGAYDMAHAVLQHGHRDIVICSDFISTEYSRQARLRGFQDALKAAGITDFAARTYHVAPEQLQVENSLLKRILQRFPHATAILTDSDFIAFKLWLGQQQLELPRPLCITGFGNLKLSSVVLPTVDQLPESIGAQGVSLLIEQLNNPEYTPLQEIQIPTRLVNLDLIPDLQ